MNRDLAKYILSLKDEVSLRIWLAAISKAARNGTVNLMYKDILLENRFTKKADLLKYFNPREAHEMEVIKILIETDTFISINFRKGTKQIAGDQQKKLMQQTNTKTLPEKNAPAANLLPAVQAQPTTKGFLTAIPKKYIPTDFLIKAVISDYILFFKQLQVDKASLVGISLMVEDAAAPKISGESVKHFKELCLYFSKLSGITNEEQIKRCFHRVYTNWHNFTEFIQKGFEPRHIHGNINNIIIQIQNKNHGNKDKRETELNSKLAKTERKDYGKFVKGKKGK